MVIGNGLVAKAFSKYKNNDECIIFASGVSNSKETNSKEFLREKEILVECLKSCDSGLFVYFSTCSINNVQNNMSPYISHKMEMEDIIKEKSRNYFIFRLPQLIGKTENKNTLLNYLYLSIINDVRFDLWDGTYRNLIDIEDVFSICDKFIRDVSQYKNSVKNIALRNNYGIKEIVEILELVSKKKAHYNIIHKEDNHKIEIGEDVAIKLKEINLYDNDIQYLKTVIEKYYKN